MEDEKLIECVKRHQHLYDLRHPKYMDNVKKDMAWKEISQEVKLPPSACKQRWQSLRDCYRRANKRRFKLGTAVKIKQWKYEDEMAFLEPFLGYKKKDTGESEDSEDNAEAQIGSRTIESGNFNNDAGSEFNYGSFDLNKDTSAALLVHLLEEKKRSSENTHDVLDEFFLSISATCKKFSPYTQAVLKKKIFNLVSEVEIEELAPTVSSSIPIERNSMETQEVKQEITEETVGFQN